MENLSAGKVVLAGFPFSNFVTQKIRPCLVVGKADFSDVILCQITSKPYGGHKVIDLNPNTDFSTGTIAQNSFIRPDKLVTMDRKLVVDVLGTLKVSKMREVKLSLKEIFEIS